MERKLETCKNCEEQFRSSFKFCPYCGQQAKDELTVKILFYNTISNYFSFDARFFKSFLPLLFKPGYLASKFIAGKRLLYLHPAQMYLFVTVVFFFLFSFVQRQQVKDMDEKVGWSFNQMDSLKSINNESLKVGERLKQIIPETADKEVLENAFNQNEVLEELYSEETDSLIDATKSNKKDIVELDYNTKAVDSLLELGASNDLIYKAMGMPDEASAFKKRMYSQALKFYKSRKGGGILQTFYDAIPFAMFFLLPIFALILKLLYRKRGLYAHHLVFSFYYFAFLFTVFSIILIINFIYDIPDWIDFILMLSTFGYLLFAVKRFYRQGWFASIFKASLTMLLFLSLVAPLTVIVLGVFAFLFY
ncbi:DUF3667 domain-containing protein [Flavisericum labens]|uniref:DUF3667 domain-containing protein n=1 Tax=Flavisericum labens TaxID=3377112 RepID=UPI00387B04C8